MNPLYPIVAQRAEHRCEYCHAPEEVFNFPFEVEHLVPRAHGGSDSLDNLALSCHACNRYKSDFEMGYDPETAQDVSLFHPRRAVWKEHFSVDFLNGHIRGLTPTGRATIMRLQMNRLQQLRARLHWIQLDLYYS